MNAIFKPRSDGRYSRSFVSIRGFYGFDTITFSRRLTHIRDLRAETTGAMGLLVG